MKLFHWDRVSALANYAPGEVVAIGATVEEARAAALAAFEVYARERWSYLFDEWVDDSDRERWAEIMAKFEADIAAEPKTAAAVCISGSE